MSWNPFARKGQTGNGWNVTFPRGNPDQPWPNRDAPLTSSGWSGAEDRPPLFGEGMIFLGRDRAGQARGSRDDRHLVTVAGSRAGKGRSVIIPNLILWPGSCVVIDPKGENAFATAEERSRRPGHQVAILDPFGIPELAALPEGLRGGTFNPLSLIDTAAPDAPDEVDLIADALIVPETGSGSHWTLAARNLLRGLIWHVAVTRTGPARTLSEVRRLLTLPPNGADSWDTLLREMRAAGGLAAETAGLIAQKSEGERSGVVSTAAEQTAFLSSPAMQGNLVDAPASAVLLDRLKTCEGGFTLYLCLPARRLATHGRWLRLVVQLALSRMEALGTAPPAGGHPVLFLLDEFAALGRLESIEKAAGLMAGYHVKLWPILQDLTQLKRDYRESWETFLGNAGVLQFFGNTDLTTLKHISERLGEVEILRTVQSASASSSTNIGGPLTGQASYGSGSGSSAGRSETLLRAPLLTSDEVARYFARDTGLQLVLIPDTEGPRWFWRCNHDQDELFQGRFRPRPAAGT